MLAPMASRARHRPRSCRLATVVLFAVGAARTWSRSFFIGAAGNAPRHRGQLLRTTRCATETLRDVLPATVIEAAGLSSNNVSTARTQGRQVKLIRDYILKHAGPNISRMHIYDVEIDRVSYPRYTQALPDVGLHTFEWQNQTLYALVQERRTSKTDADTEIVIFVQGVGRCDFLQSFCDELGHLQKLEQQTSFKVYRFDTGGGGLLGSLADEWRSVASVPARAMDSVVLPAKLKDDLVDDLDDFLNASTRKFFNKHGVPYRRGYLFHGVPGSGKTSLIQALAGQYRRNLCILQPTGPKWGDMELQRAIDLVPSGSFVVLEDVDAMFSLERINTAGSGVTFAGLLKGLEGSMSENGIVFILTTNHREKLDEAMLRPGRVDKQFSFDAIQPPEIEEMFRQFYPEQPGLASAFCKAVRIALPEDHFATLSAAQLQHYFIRMRRHTAQEALEKVSLLRQELQEREVEEEFFGFGSEVVEQDDDASSDQALGVLLKELVGTAAEVDTTAEAAIPASAEGAALKRSGLAE